jgi:cyclase
MREKCRNSCEVLVNRTLIVARIRPGSESEVARIFAESDTTSLPVEAGVVERSLYSLQDVYIHVIDFDRDGSQSVAAVQDHKEFRDVSDRLAEFISPYSPTWKSPRDATAARFYHWHR